MQKHLSEQTRKRIANRAQILRTLHLHGPLRRADLSRRCRIRKSSVTSILDELSAHRLIAEDTPGSPRSRVGLDHERCHAVAGLITPTQVCATRVFLDGRMDAPHASPIRPEADPTERLEALATHLADLLRAGDEFLLGVGAAVPGLVNTATGVGLRAANLRDWNAIPVRAELERRIGRPVFVENDIRCACWASLWFQRLLLHHRDILYVVLAEGVGGALFLKDALVRGSGFAAGEFGHVRAGDERRRCRCGKLDCVEAYASLPAILAELRVVAPALGEVHSAEEVARASERDPVVRNVLDRSMARVASVLATVVAAVDPSLILLGAQAPEFYRAVKPLLEKHLGVELGPMHAEAVTMDVAEGGVTAPLQGAAGLVIQEAFERSEVLSDRAKAGCDGANGPVRPE